MAFYAIDRIGAVANWVDMKVSPAEVEEVPHPGRFPGGPGAGGGLFQGLPSPGKGPYPALRGAAPGPLRGPGTGGKAPSQHLAAGGQVRTACPGRTFSAPLPKCRRRQTGGKSRWPSPTPGGTTGPAKGVVLSRRSFAWALEYYARAETEYGRGGFALVLLPALCCVWPESMPPHPALFGDGGDSLSHVPSPMTWAKCCAVTGQSRSAAPQPTGSFSCRMPGRRRQTSPS